MSKGCNLPAKICLAIRYTPCKTWFRAIQISYKLVGEEYTEHEKPPIFILHGLLSRKTHWKGLAKTIHSLTKRAVVTLDMRNHGNSPHVNSHKYEDMANDIIRLLDKLKVNKASFVGHSMGGRTAMCTALTAPKRVAGLVVVDTSPVSTDPQFLKIYDLLVAMKAIDFKFPKKVHRARKDAKKALKNYLVDGVIKKEVLSNIEVKSDGIIGWICNLDILIKHFDHIASFPMSMKGKMYKGPTLFIGGQLSDYIPADDLTYIRELFPRAVITYIKSTTHNLHVEDPKSFLELVIRFLNTNN